MTAAFLVIFCVVLAGCGGAHAAAASEGSGGGGAGAGGMGGSPSSDAGMAAPSGGYLYLTSFAQGPAQVTTLSGELWRAIPDLSCAPSTVEGCTISTCSPIPDGPGSVSAGRLRITGGMFPVDLSPSITPSHVTYADTEEMALFHGGETLVIAADGADVPAFSTMVICPTAVKVSSPPSKTIALTAGADLAFVWSGGAAGEILVQVTSEGATATCGFPAASAGGAVPSAVLAALPVGAASVVVTVRSRVAVETGMYSVDLQVASATPSFSGTLMLP